MHIELKYGNRKLQGEIPFDAQLLQPCIPPPAENPALQVHRALDRPLAVAPFEQIFSAGERVVIVTSDITRYTGSEIYLPILVERLNACGIADTDISILIALGIHRPQTEAEHRKILGPLFGRIKVFDHACDDPAQLVELGETSAGIPVAVNRRVVETDRVIVTGTVGFHYFAGFGGGRKGLVPGVAARKTCMASHFSVFNKAPQTGKHPQATAGVLDDNPVHHNLLEAARMVRCDLLINTVLSPQKEILGVYAGELEAAHLAACEQVQDLYQPRTERVDLAIISSGGEPKDINLIQAQKALDYGCRAVREGGTIVLLAACRDGFGHEHFYPWFDYQDLAQFEAALRENYQINGQTAHSLLSKARRFRVIMVSEFDAEITARMGMEKARDLQQAIDMAHANLSSMPKTLVIPDGGLVLPHQFVKVKTFADPA
ncbi:nickel-dependent lactate racemase [Geopsychrobacter electrodiphilus]|uniref:nickel-dependent lactate racemase n=1 Tax=Geopsychrobacter electrodiphilus TaxID=225196 RepID=UPI0003670D01|nr:nickel-dependent lactate racemase [Geopsychrobacter electrodiphilus]